MAFNRPIPESKQPARDSGGVQTLVQAEKMMQIALLLPSAAFVGWLAGAWLDGKLHQSWMGLAGIVFGGVSGLVYVVRLVMVSGGGGTGSGGSASGSPKPGSSESGSDGRSGSGSGKSERGESGPS